MAYSTIPNYANLTANQLATAPNLPFSAYNGSVPGYNNLAQYNGNFAGAQNFALFSFTAVAGAVYSVQSTSYLDPGTLLVYDNTGRPIAEDDHTGVPGQDHLSFVALYSGTYYVDAWWLQGTLPDQQAVSLKIYEDVYTLQGTNIDGTASSENLDGKRGDDNIFGFSGNDSLLGGGGYDYLDGGAGLDEAYYQGNRSEYTVQAFGDRFKVTDKTGRDAEDVLSNIERISFNDVNVGLDINGPSGQAYRLYQAAFNRVPDEAGLGFWIYHMDNGLSLLSAAEGFVASPEFRALYGAQTTNTALVTAFYNNVLHRAPEKAGLDFWVNVLDTHQASVAGVLIGFSESPENYAALVGVMSDGVEYQRLV